MRRFIVGTDVRFGLDDAADRRPSVDGGDDERAEQLARDPDKVVEDFRAFIDQVRPEDFQ